MERVDYNKNYRMIIEGDVEPMDVYIPKVDIHYMFMKTEREDELQLLLLIKVSSLDNPGACFESQIVRNYKRGTQDNWFETDIINRLKLDEEFIKKVGRPDGNGVIYFYAVERALTDLICEGKMNLLIEFLGFEPINDD